MTFQTPKQVQIPCRNDFALVGGIALQSNGNCCVGAVATVWYEVHLKTTVMGVLVRKEVSFARKRAGRYYPLQGRKKEAESKTLL